MGWFYVELTGLAAGFPDPANATLSGNYRMLKMKAVGGPVEFSFNGNEVHGKLDPSDGFQDFARINVSHIYAKTSGGGSLYVHAWGDDE